MYSPSKFKAAWWLKNPHLQTIAAKFLRRNLSLITQPEILELSDGDFIELAWTEQPQQDNTKPIVVVLHGLEGSKDSHYAKGILKAIKANNWIGVLMHFRGCNGKPNRLASAYHSGDTRDIHYLTQLLMTRYPQSQFAAIGYSLGGNVLTRYLAEQQDNPYVAATIICAPLDLASCSDRINSGFSKVYQKYLVAMLKQSTLAKINIRLITHIRAQQVNSIKTIREFDHEITAPINGFSSAEDYYEKMSGNQVIRNIQQPCLFLHAADDPFLFHQKILPKKRLPPHITFEISANGGHVGFIAGNNPFKPQYWLEQRIGEFLAEKLTITPHF